MDNYNKALNVNLKVNHKTGRIVQYTVVSGGMVIESVTAEDGVMSEARMDKIISSLLIMADDFSIPYPIIDDNFDCFPNIHEEDAEYINDAFNEQGLFVGDGRLGLYVAGVSPQPLKKRLSASEYRGRPSTLQSFFEECAVSSLEKSEIDIKGHQLFLGLRVATQCIGHCSVKGINVFWSLAHGEFHWIVEYKGTVNSGCGSEQCVMLFNDVATKI